MLSKAMAARIGSKGGNARVANQSPEQRRDLAKYARSERARKAQGLPGESDIVAAAVELVRKTDPDLAALIRLSCRLPYRFQQRIPMILSAKERVLSQQAFALIQAVQQ